MGGSSLIVWTFSLIKISWFIVCHILLVFVNVLLCSLQFEIHEDFMYMALVVGPFKDRPLQSDADSVSRMFLKISCWGHMPGHYYTLTSACKYMRLSKKRFLLGQMTARGLITVPLDKQLNAPLEVGFIFLRFGSIIFNLLQKFLIVRLETPMNGVWLSYGGVGDCCERQGGIQGGGGGPGGQEPPPPPFGDPQTS